MNKLKVAILEDSTHHLQFLKGILESENLAKVVACATNSADFMELVGKQKPDALLLDIEIGNDAMTGLDVAYELKMPVMFVSGHNKQNLKDIEELKREFDFTVDHITKPVSTQNFIKSAGKFLAEVERHLSAKYVLLSFKGSRGNRIPVASIVCLESEPGGSGQSNNKTIFFTDRRPEILVDFSFSKMGESGLSPNLFIEPHRSYRVNVQAISCYNKNHTVSVQVMAENGSMETKYVPVSENYQHKVKSLLR